MEEDIIDETKEFFKFYKILLIVVILFIITILLVVIGTMFGWWQVPIGIKFNMIQISWW